MPSDPTPIGGAGRPATDASGEPLVLGEFRGFEVYPMPMFVTIAAADVAGAAAWYDQALGFAAMFTAPGPPGQPSMVHLRRRKYQDVLLVPGRSGGAGPAPGLTVTFMAGEDVDALAARARAVSAVGASAVEGPFDTPWNTRDLRIVDPDGHRLVFTSPRAEPDPEQLARVKQMFDDARRRG